MKLRIRLGKRNERIEISKESTVHDLKLKIASCFNVSCDAFKLSLNGKDAISTTDTSPLSVLELVSGDLLKLITEDKIASPGPQREAPTTSAVTPNERLVPEGALSQGVTPDNSSVIENSTHGADVTLVEKTFPKEPMLIRDCSSNRLTHRLWEVWKEGLPQSISEGLSLVLHSLMLETGFQVYYAEKSDGSINATDSTSVEISCLLPPSWRQFGCCRFSYTHQRCNQSHICHLACVPLGSVISVTGIVGGENRESFSLQFSPEEYVTQWKETLSLCNTAKLSRIFKDTVAHPMFYSLKESSGLPPSHGLLALAVETQLKILSYLDLRSLLNVSEVCHTLHGLSQDETLWRLLCLADLKLKDKSQKNCSTWKQAYQKQYKEDLDRRKAEEAWRREMLARINQPNFTPVIPQYFPGGYHPGIRGGDYDRDPFPARPFHQPRPDLRAFQPLRPRHDPIFHDPDLDPQPGAGRGLRDGPSRGNFGLRRGGGLGSFGSGGSFFL